MTEVSVVPWSLCWVGCITLIGGLVLALHGIGQRNPSRVADGGMLIGALGIALLVAPPLVNGGLQLLGALHTIALEAVASARPLHDADR
jgi:hypothetical protein